MSKIYMRQAFCCLLLISVTTIVYLLVTLQERVVFKVESDTDHKTSRPSFKTDTDYKEERVNLTTTSKSSFKRDTDHIKERVNLTTTSPKSSFKYLTSVEEFANAQLIKPLETSRKDFNFTLLPWKIDPKISRSSKLNISDSDIRWSMVVLVKSRSNNFHKRKIARWTWATLEYVNGFRMEVIFIVGRMENEKNKTLLKKEHGQFGDLLQLDMEEKYDDVVYKTLAGMKYASNHFPKDWMYTSADDDIMPDLILIQEKIDEMIKTTNDVINTTSSKSHSNCIFEHHSPIVCGFKYNLNPKPRRNNDSKWCISETEYPLNHYPPYCNGGWYSMSLSLATKLHDLSRKLSSFWIDDIYVTGFLRLRYFNDIKKNCVLNDTTVGLWTKNSRYMSFTQTGNDDVLMTEWKKNYAAKIFSKKYVYIEE